MESEYEYLKRKITIHAEDKEPCGCDRKSGFCGQCFWQGISKNPDLERIPQCSKCCEDTKRFAQMNQDERSKFKTSCSPWCLWFEWFATRRSILSEKSST